MSGEPGGSRAGALLVGLLLAARLLSVPWSFLWRDWAALTLLAALVILLRPRRDPSPVLAAAGAWLFAVYLVGQGPHLLALWRAGP